MLGRWHSNTSTKIIMSQFSNQIWGGRSDGLFLEFGGKGLGGTAAVWVLDIPMHRLFALQTPRCIYLVPFHAGSSLWARYAGRARQAIEPPGSREPTWTHLAYAADIRHYGHFSQQYPANPVKWIMTTVPGWEGGTSKFTVFTKIAGMKMWKWSLRHEKGIFWYVIWAIFPANVILILKL
jgi:hypothetical protein